ncbi:hypothetical protein OA165_00065 [Prochlorococcus sp. AH-736-A21]|nr:hypothetical protein [Prochlorococcus sp. AH-736-A21]
MVEKVQTLVIPYSFWFEENHLTKEEIQLIAEKSAKNIEPDYKMRFVFDCFNGDMIGIYFEPDDPDANNFPLVSWKHLETFLFNQKNWEVAKRKNANGENVILDVVDDQGNFEGKSYLVLQEHKFGNNMSDLLKASKSPIPIPPPKGFG